MADQQDVEEKVPETNKTPDSRICSVESALKFSQRLIDADKSRDITRARIQGQIDGNPPYDKSKLKRLGQGHRANLNFRDAEGYKDRRKTSFYELLLEVEHLVSVRILEEGLPNEDLEYYNGIIAEEFTRMVKDWDGFLVNILLHMDEIVVHGVNTCYWPDEYDWRFKTTRMGQFLLPENTEPTAEGISYCIIRSKYSASELYQRVRTTEEEQKSKDAGWSPDMIKMAIGKAIRESGSTQDEFQLGDWESVQQQMKENELSYSYEEKQSINVDHVLIKEYDGKISHFIVLEEWTEEQGKEFLFKSERRFDSFCNVINLSMTSIGEGTYHTIRGLGTKIFGHCQLNDRMKNTVVDGGMTAATVLLQSPNAGARQRARVTRLGPVTLLPDGFNVVTAQFQPNLQGLVGVIGMLDAGLKGNVGVQRPDVTDEPGSRPPQTLGDSKNREYREAKLEKTDINLYYSTVDKLWKETMRRALNPKATQVDGGYEDAKRFRDNCIARGVPEYYLKADSLSVKASRAIGLGSPALRAMTAEAMLGASQYFDERGKQNALREYVAVQAGFENVERYAGRANRNRIPTEAHTIASLENNDHRQGEVTIVGQDEPHVIHLLVHMEPLMQVAEGFVTGEVAVPAEQLATYMSVAIQHSAQHMDYLASDASREEELAQFNQQLQEVVKIFEQVAKQAAAESKQRELEQQRQAEVVGQAQEQVQSDELKAKLAEIQADIQLRVMKEQGLQQVRVAKAQQSMQIKEALAQQKLRHEDLKTLTGGANAGI